MGRDPRVTLAALAHPGLKSAAAPRLVDADIRVDSLFSWRYQVDATQQSLAADGAIAKSEIMLLLCLIVALTATAHSTPVQSILSNAQAQEASKEPALRRELLRRVAQDQAIRNELISKGVKQPDQAILARMQALATPNTKRMRRIVRRYGWPGPELVGRDGAEAAFLLVHHADHAFQKEILPLVEKAYRSGRLSGQDYALLLDRVLVGEGKPQVYGTQAKRFEEWKGQEPALEPIEDEANVDKRRAVVGLPPLSEYREMLKRMYFPQNQVKP